MVNKNLDINATDVKNMRKIIDDECKKYGEDNITFQFTPQQLKNLIAAVGLDVIQTCVLDPMRKEITCGTCVNRGDNKLCPWDEKQPNDDTDYCSRRRG